MKKLIALTLCAMLLMAAASLARPAFGVKAGVAFSKQTFDYTELEPGFDTRAGFQFGFFLEYPVNRYFSLVPEFRYVPVGVKYSIVYVQESGYVGGPVSETRKTRVDYLSVPLMIKARLPMKKFTPYVIAGPRVDFQLGTGADSRDFSQLYDQFDQITAGFTFGGGVQFKLSPRYNLLVEASYSPDVTKVYETDLLNIRNHTLSIVTGVTF
jgi:opacity protein-like surface antigen